MKKILLALVLLGLTGTAQAAGDPDAGKAKSASCGSCHGADGNSSNPLWPKLAGQHASYIKKQLLEFKSGARKDPTMTAMAAGLNEQDMEDLAAYYASKKVAPGAARRDRVALGKQIYLGGIKERQVAACVSCHGAKGIGNPVAKFPTVTGQHVAYAVKQLKDFRAGTRANDPQHMMRDIVGKLQDDEMEAVAEYMSGLY